SPPRSWTPGMTGAAEGLASAILSASTLLEMQAVLIDGWMPVEVRAEIVRRTEAAFFRLDLSGVEPPAIRAGTAERLGTAFPDEVRPLAAEVDALLEQRERQVTAARARASDLAHGLKTPLQVLAGDIDRLQAKGEGAIAADLAAIGETMRRHVERELARTRRFAGSAAARAVVAMVAAQVIAVVRRTPRGAALEWSHNVPPDVAVRIQPDDLAEILGNLLENAARHAAERIEIRAVAEADHVVVSVVDDGPGIPQAQVPVALRRGGRLDQAGPGTGLGLAIAADLAEAWGGALTLGPTSPGAMTAVVRLPRAG
ncbi:MAG: HAMP domain-containing histidine kinase, partial [Methylacidiphilales bacterium]|nr:HAMP domain-containing histidine kinase [Candidatus Methylacidiphilales bacterium]